MMEAATGIAVAIVVVAAVDVALAIFCSQMTSRRDEANAHKAAAKHASGR